LSYLMLVERLSRYSKKGRKCDLAAPSTNLKVSQEQQTQKQSNTFLSRRPLKSLPL